MNILLMPLYTVFARGGGGGSSGGSSGGGSSHSSSSSYGDSSSSSSSRPMTAEEAALFGNFMLGVALLVSGVLLAAVINWLTKKINKSRLFHVLVVSSVSVIALATGFILNALPGLLFSLVFITGLWISFGVSMLLEKSAAENAAKIAKLQNDVAIAGQSDPIWSKNTLIEQAQNAFMRYQQDWSSMDKTQLSSYLSPEMVTRTTLFFAALKQLGRKNLLSDVSIHENSLEAAHDDSQNNSDTFTIAFSASMDDRLIDARTDRKLFESKSSFIEHWSFRRSNNTWLVDSIGQQTADDTKVNNELKQLAAQNGLHYSLDMGWLLLPRSGLLFKEGTFGTSDINNHVIGIQHNLLVQYYTFVADTNTLPAKQYLVSQIMLPKSYGNIVIKPDVPLWKRLGSTIPSDYQKHEFEWPDFNERYDVYATNSDQLATFELLNPGFMAYLYDTDASLTIEVADNTVYVYKETSAVNHADYALLLGVMERAFKELQL